ncbi:MRG/MORF4L-binding protein isoform X2 [Lucilia sericata]|uniref:MRG/MORF4L-binding protein isoform X2 n=1 Tax=Lucilia sericata TaxID=13632 RepID=UPI0018A84043|nr:MRG/MORF4L-binding protein isoform X2 [Lucilia sericata]
MTMTAREKSLLAAADHEWTAEEEIQLFYAMGGLKPVGVNRHFYIACITDRLSRSLNRDYTTESIWVHLRTMYNLEALEDLEPLPFPNEEREFSLPEAEFSTLLSKKRAASEESRQSNEGPPSIIAVVTDNTINKTLSSQTKTSSSLITSKELDKKLTSKLTDAPKRTPKRTRGSMSLESSSPSTTPPPIQSNKRRRI